jgi:hypothetical protein
MERPSIARRDWFLTSTLLVLGTGVSLHVSRLVFGRDWLPAPVPELAFLMLAVFVTLAAASLWACPAHGQVAVLTRVAAVPFTLSLPVHLTTSLTQRTDLPWAFPIGSGWW